MKVLVLGGTGAMGVYLVDELLHMGREVVVTTRSKHEADKREGLTYLVGNAREEDFLTQALMGAHFDAVVDFMARPAAEFARYRMLLLSSTDQYIFLSSYRVYADSPYITEESPRLLDVCEEKDYLATNEYALDKARCEDMLRESGETNWTIVRPSVTFSRARFQLGTLEAEDWLWRWQQGLEVPLSPEMLDKQATLTWGGMPLGLSRISSAQKLQWGKLSTSARPSITPGAACSRRTRTFCPSRSSCGRSVRRTISASRPTTTSSMTVCTTVC